MSSVQDTCSINFPRVPKHQRCGQKFGRTLLVRSILLFAIAAPSGCASREGERRAEKSIGQMQQLATTTATAPSSTTSPPLPPPVTAPLPKWVSYKHKGKVADLIAFVGGVARLKKLSIAPQAADRDAQGKLVEATPSITYAQFTSKFRSCAYSYVKGSDLIAYGKSLGLRFPPKLGIETARISVFRGDPYIGLVVDQGNALHAFLMADREVTVMPKGLKLASIVPSSAAKNSFFSPSVCL